MTEKEIEEKVAAYRSSLYEQMREEKKDAFIKHLQYCSEVVKSWPKWKREALGRRD